MLFPNEPNLETSNASYSEIILISPRITLNESGYKLSMEFLATDVGMRWVEMMAQIMPRSCDVVLHTNMKMDSYLFQKPSL